MIPVAAFDLETTGTDVENDRIVSAAIVLLDELGRVEKSEQYLVDPGVPIPEEATAVHGITTAHAQAEGKPANRAIPMIVSALDEFTTGRPLVVYNAPFDLTMLARELARYFDVEPLDAEPFTPVLDPLVWDKHFDQYRPKAKASRTLTDVCGLFSVPLGEDAHGSLADAIAAGRLAQQMLALPQLAAYSPEALHAASVGWYEDQAIHYRDYRASIGQPIELDTWWPLRPLEAS